MYIIDILILCGKTEIIFKERRQAFMRKNSQFRKPNLKRLTDLYKEDKNQLLTPGETAELIGESEQKLANDRWRSMGMTYDKIKGRCFYRPKYIIDHFRKNMHRVEPRF